MSFPLSVDVAILGGGPAGSTLAALLADRGIHVALIDRDAFPRDKLCGEFLSYDALPILHHLGVGEEIDARGAAQVTRCRVIGERTVYEFSLPSPARGVSRLLLDEALIRTAAKKGARVMAAWTAVRVAPGANGSRSVELRRGAETHLLNARIVVGAWGRWGRFDKEMKRQFADDATHRHFGFKRHYRPLTNEAQDSIDLYSFGQGYLGVSAIEGGLVNICGLVHRSRIAGLKGGWDHFVVTLSEEKATLRRLFASNTPAQKDFLSSEPVIFRAKSAVEQGIYMIGDAAGLIDPLTGNGMAMAIQSALVAAPHILQRLTSTSDETENAARYAVAYKNFFHNRIAWSRRIAFLLSRPGLLEQTMRLSAAPSIGAFLLKKTRAEGRSVERMLERWDSGRPVAV